MSGYAHTMGTSRGKRNRQSKSGELIVARTADEAVAIRGRFVDPRVYITAATRTRVRDGAPSLLPSSLSLLFSASLPFSLFRPEACDGGCNNDAAVPRWWC